MKKHIKLILGITLVAFSVQAIAQDSKTSTTVTTTTTVNNDESKGSSDGDYPAAYVGFRFMPTVSYFDYQTIDNTTGTATAVVSYGWGGFIGFNITDHFALQGEVLYSPLAQQFKVAERVHDVRLDYINIPLLMRLNTGYSKPVNLNFVFGPQIGLNIGSEVETTDNGAGTTVEAKAAVKTGDLGLAYGAGLDFALGGYTRLGIGFRGVYGLVDISDNSGTQETENYYILDKTHMETYSGYIGISFGF